MVPRVDSLRFPGAPQSVGGPGYGGMRCFSYPPGQSGIRLCGKQIAGRPTDLAAKHQIPLQALQVVLSHTVICANPRN